MAQMIGSTVLPLGSNQLIPLPSLNLLERLALWLYVSAQHPGADPRSCAERLVEKRNNGMREFAPMVYQRALVERDAFMSARLREACTRLADEAMRSGEQLAHLRAVAIVGAQHVPGMRKQLAHPPSVTPK